MTVSRKLEDPDCVVSVDGKWAETWGVNAEGFGVITYDDDGNDGEIYIEPYLMEQHDVHRFTVDGVEIVLYRAVLFIQ
jgi:hypothetical protein